MPPLGNARHERFAQELANGKCQSEAYKAAGYKPSRSGACHLAAKPNILQRVNFLLTERAKATTGATAKAIERLSLNKEWVLTRLMENAERALQNCAVLDEKGNPTGEYRYEGSVANRSLELLGKHLGILIDRTEHGRPGDFDRMDDDMLLAEIRKDAAELGLPVPATKGNGKTQH